MDKLERDKLEHNKIRLQIDNLQADLSTRFNVVLFEIKKSNEVNSQTLAQATKTNGRVNKLEEKVEGIEHDVEFIRIIRKNKWMLAMLFAAAMFIVQNFSTEWILKKLGF